MTNKVLHKNKTHIPCPIFISKIYMVLSNKLRTLCVHFQIYMWKNYKSLWQKTFQYSHDRNKRKCCLHLDSIERKAYFITIRRCCIKMWLSSVYYMEYTRPVCINMYKFLVCEIMTKIEALISVAIYWVCRLGLTASKWMCSLKISNYVN